MRDDGCLQARQQFGTAERFQQDVVYPFRHAQQGQFFVVASRQQDDGQPGKLGLGINNSRRKRRNSQSSSATNRRGLPMRRVDEVCKAKIPVTFMRRGKVEGRKKPWS